jgi:hypothetical protein
VKAEKFESLSDEALYTLAERMGLALPPDLARVFVVEEILEALEEDSEERRGGGVASVRIEESKYSGSEMDDVAACLDCPPAMERSYNETTVKVLVRDPSWAFAFWDLAEADRQSLRSEDEGAAVFLRVYETTEADRPENKRDFFDIPVSEDDLQWYINLPRPKARYRIDLCARSEGKVRVLARSKEAAVPRQILEDGLGNLSPATVQLLRLSGLETLDIEPPENENPQRILKSGPATE